MFSNINKNYSSVLNILNNLWFFLYINYIKMFS